MTRLGKSLLALPAALPSPWLLDRSFLAELNWPALWIPLFGQHLFVSPVEASEFKVLQTDVGAEVASLRAAKTTTTETRNERSGKAETKGP